MNQPFIKRNATCTQDAVEKAYAAGLITKNGTIIAYGVGAERGTWNSFANINFKDTNSLIVMDSLAWFIDVHNQYEQNYVGKTPKHKFFKLTHQGDEIEDLLTQFKIQDLLSDAMDEVAAHDELHGLKEENKIMGKIRDWRERTLRINIPLLNSSARISESVVESLSTLASVELLINAFNEGMKGLTLGADDLAMLMEGKTILSRYTHKTAA